VKKPPLSPEEKRKLVELFRALSPSGLERTMPDLGPDLALLVGKRLPRRPGAILFDVYGTIVMSAAGGEPALGGEIAIRGGEARDLLEAELKSASFRGGAIRFAREVDLSITRTREAAMPGTPDPEVDIEDIVSSIVGGREGGKARLVSVLLEAWRNPCAAMPGASALLSRLSASGQRLGIVSNAQFYTPLLVEALFGSPPEGLGFEAGICAYSYENLRAKPDTEPFIRAAEPLLASGLKAGEILVVGNSWANDMAPARGLGFMTALYAGDSRSYRPARPPAIESRPDSILRDYDLFEAILPT